MTTTEQKPKMKHEDLIRVVETALDDQKAKNIEIIDLKGVAQFADTMVVASGTSTRHVAALARGVADKVKETFEQKPQGIEGLETNEWVLVDLGDVIVHIMLPATREFYEIEKLWKARPQANQDQNNAE